MLAIIQGAALYWNNDSSHDWLFNSAHCRSQGSNNFSLHVVYVRHANFSLPRVVFSISAFDFTVMPIVSNNYITVTERCSCSTFRCRFSTAFSCTWVSLRSAAFRYDNSVITIRILWQNRIVYIVQYIVGFICIEYYLLE